MENLEKVIKDLEFENESLVRQIKDEIETIDCIQKNIRNKSSESLRLEEDIKKADSETKALHDQLKLNKEIAESLKNATLLLYKHCTDLRSSSKLKIEETEKNRIEHEKVLENYTNKWLRYEAEYEKHPVAKEIRKHKLDAANLDAEAKKMNEEKSALEQMVKMYEKSRDVFKEEKWHAISSIVKLAALQVTTNTVIRRIPVLVKENNFVRAEIEAKEEIFKKLKSKCQIIQHKTVVPDVKTEWNNIPEQSVSAANTRSISSPFSSGLPVVTANASKTQTRVTNDLEKPIRSLQLPKLPQIPKFLKMPVKSCVQSAPTIKNNVPVLPIMTFPVSDEKRISVSSPQQYASSEDAMDMTYSVPLDQPSNEYFQQLSGMEVEVSTLQPQAAQSPYSFSPGAHAETLKQLKQSPATGLFRLGRPMFTSTSAPVDLSSPKEENGFASSFSSQNQFLETLQPSNRENTQKDGGTSDTGFGSALKNVVSSDVFTFTQPSMSTKASPKQLTRQDFSFNSMTTDMQQEALSPGFHFEISGQQSPNEKSFSFDHQLDLDTSKVQDTNFSFGIPSPGSSAFDGFSMPSTNSNMFNFGKSPARDDVTSSGGFLFPTNNTPPCTDNFNFSFGGNNVQATQDNNSNSFSFSF